MIQITKEEYRELLEKAIVYDRLRMDYCNKILMHEYVSSEDKALFTLLYGKALETAKQEMFVNRDFLHLEIEDEEE